MCSRYVTWRRCPRPHYDKQQLPMLAWCSQHLCTQPYNDHHDTIDFSLLKMGTVRPEGYNLDLCKSFSQVWWLSNHLALSDQFFLVKDLKVSTVTPWDPELKFNFLATLMILRSPLRSHFMSQSTLATIPWGRSHWYTSLCEQSAN